MLCCRGVTRRLLHETRRDTRLGSRERDETRFLHYFSEILNDEIYEWKIVFYSTENHKMQNNLGAF